MAEIIVAAALQANVGIIVRSGRGQTSREVFANDVAQQLRRGASRDGQALVEPLVVRREVDGVPSEVVFFHDATERRRTEQAHEATQERFRRLLDAAPDAVAIGTRDRFMYANPALVRLSGFATMEDVTRMPMREHVHPDDIQALQELVTAVVDGRPAPAIPIRMRGQDGRTLSVMLQAIRTEWDGEPAILGIGRDLTERQRVQSQLMQADRLAAIGTLAAGVAHEINNPLAYVLLNLQYVIRELPRFRGDEDGLDRLIERLREAQHGAERVSSIVSDLRALWNPKPDERRPVSVVEALRAAVRVTASAVQERARLVEDYAVVPPVLGSATRLEQVFVNLLINAAQAFPQGDTLHNEVRVVLRGSDDRVTVEVSDTGSGIAPELMPRVFDPFFTTKAHGIGTGLGLPICHGIVRALGGDITVQSEPGRGTVFRVSLPALAETPPAELRRRTPSAPQESAWRARILVVDDEPLVADMLQRTLGEQHDVTIATNADQALELILDVPFDVVLCDLLMPGVSGMDLYAELGLRRPGLEQRLVFMTGGAFTHRAAEFLSSVPNRRLTKPFVLAEIDTLLAELRPDTG